MHFARILTEEILHKLAQSRAVSNLTVHIYYVRTVRKYCVVKLGNRAVDRVKRLSAFKHVMLGNENDVAFRQFIELVTGVEQICVQQTAVVSRTSWSRAVVAALDLDIILLAVFINCINIQSCRTSLQIFQFKLRNHFYYRQVVPVQNHSEQKLRARFILENLAHKCVVHKPEVLDYVEQFFAMFRADIAVSIFVHSNHFPFLNYSIFSAKNQAYVPSVLPSVYILCHSSRISRRWRQK